jgi:hypothetical protein
MNAAPKNRNHTIDFCTAGIYCDVIKKGIKPGSSSARSGTCGSIGSRLTRVPMARPVMDGDIMIPLSRQFGATGLHTALVIAAETSG